MAEWVKVVILGIVEGVTEFLPISSTGHLLIFSELLDFRQSLGGTFEIFIQIGAVVAVIGFYRSDLRRQIAAVRRDPDVRRFWFAIIVAALPAGFVGLLLREIIKDTLFTQPLVIAGALILGGVVFLVIEKRSVVPEEYEFTLYDVTWRQALLVGVVQTFALIPGVSRSGAAIVGGMIAGMSRQVATAFSFYLAIPVLGGATLVDFALSLEKIEGRELFPLLLGAVVSGLVAWIAIGWLLNYVARHDFVLFGYYRCLAGAIVLLLVVFGLM